MEMKNMGSPVKVGKMDATSFSSKYGLIGDNFLMASKQKLFLLFLSLVMLLFCNKLM